ncbi:MAG: GNAT family N-acetyltransferase [Oscillospiraceae bacterium]|nr:GNAT family N-acetyltransferase [Oscillospiraceae bacterium]
MNTPILETERMLLRPPQITDAEAVFANWATDFEVTKYLRWNAHASIDETLEWLARTVEGIPSDDSYEWVLIHKESGETFGSAGIFYNEKRSVFEIGYCIMKKYWNKGLTTEVVREILDFGTRELKQTKFFAMHAKENPASGKVLEKAGFVYFEDGEYDSFDGKRVFESRNMMWEGAR